MVLIISLVMALVPLLGIAWIFVRGSLLTLDGLLMTLILLAISGAFTGYAVLELRRRRRHPAAARAAGSAGPEATPQGLRQSGRVVRVEFFEAGVGLPNTSIVTLSHGADPLRTLALAGDVRNALPAGRRVEFEFRKENGRNILVNVSHP
jgi:hypothetical protein